MGTSSSPVFPYPGGVAGQEPADPAAGRPGHFAWSRWIKQFVKNLNTKTMQLEDRLDALNLASPTEVAQLKASVNNLSAQVGSFDGRLNQAQSEAGYAAHQVNELNPRLTNLEPIVHQSTMRMDALEAKANNIEGRLNELVAQFNNHHH